jgi:hypothetical protein
MVASLTARLLGLGAIIALGGCVSMGSDVVPIGRNTYQLKMTSVGFGSQADTNAKALKMADSYCNELGKHLVFERNTESDADRFNSRKSNLIFECLDENDPDYQRAKDHAVSLVPSSAAAR